MEQKQRVLIVEDDIDLAQWMADYLTAKQYEVEVTHRGDDAVNLILRNNPDVVILDGMLPGMDGMDVCRAVRPGFTNPIIMVTAMDEETDEVLGLELGADDYLIKPVRARALLTRIRKLTGRQTETAPPQAPQAPASSADILRFNNLVIDRQAMVVSLEGEKLKISSNEFEVLWVLAQQAGQIVHRQDLVKQLRGFDYDGFDRSIDLRISRLRKKLKDDAAEPFRIKTVWGKGYLFAKDAW